MNYRNTSPGLWEKLGAGDVKSRHDVPRREYKIVAAAELTTGRARKEKMRGPGENSSAGSSRSRRKT